jgi:hypothetical protein
VRVQTRGQLTTGVRQGKGRGLSFLTRIRPRPASDFAVTTSDEASTERPRRRWRTVVARTVTTLAAVLVFAALVIPNRPDQLTPAAFVRVPIEALIGAVFVLVLPARLGRLGRIAIALGGVLLGLVTLKKMFDIGFYSVLDRSFDPVSDWPLVSDAENFLERSIGRAGAIGCAILAVLLVVAILVLMALSAVRLARLVARRRVASTGTVAVFGIVWVICFALSVQLVPGVWVASRAAAGTAYYGATQVAAGIRDKRAFAAKAAADPYRTVPGDQLLAGLHGKDVLLTFVESYGRTALDDPQVNAILDDGTRQLDAAGFASRSAFLTSSTFGGGSWFAHGTMQSGLWVDSQQRYRTLVNSDRLTLSSAFRKANWRTVCVMPATDRNWPEAAYFGYQQIYDTRNLGYRGPRFAFASTPDQFTLSSFHRSELAAAGHPPVFAEIDLLSSHVPWTPAPRLVDWKDLGDGSIFRTTPPADESNQIRAQYLTTIQYSLRTLISYVQTYGDDNMVLVFLGDHQPAPAVSGVGAGHQVPITIVARDKAVLDRISGWGWQDGLRPNRQAPDWSMAAFRDRFLAAFGSR